MTPRLPRLLTLLLGVGLGSLGRVLSRSSARVLGWL